MGSHVKPLSTTVKLQHMEKEELQCDHSEVSWKVMQEKVWFDCPDNKYAFFLSQGLQISDKSMAELVISNKK